MTIENDSDNRDGFERDHKKGQLPAWTDKLPFAHKIKRISQGEGKPLDLSNLTPDERRAYNRALTDENQGGRLPPSREDVNVIARRGRKRRKENQ